MLMSTPTVQAEQDRSICVEDLTEVVMSRRRLRQAKKRLVPPATGWHVVNTDNRPQTFHRNPSCGQKRSEDNQSIARKLCCKSRRRMIIAHRFIGGSEAVVTRQSVKRTAEIKAFRKVHISQSSVPRTLNQIQHPPSAWALDHSYSVCFADAGKTRISF